MRYTSFNNNKIISQCCIVLCGYDGVCSLCCVVCCGMLEVYYFQEFVIGWRNRNRFLGW